MSVIVFSSLLFATSIAAGLLGALTGLGGGVVIVPVLVLLFGVDIRYAIGASLVSVIATSSGAAVAYVREGLSNIRIGMFLEVATTLGALLGAYLTAKISGHWIAIIFGVVLLYSALSSFRQWSSNAPAGQVNPLAQRLELSGTYPGPNGPVSYTAERVPLGFGIMFGAGTLSGLLGIGSGAVKVLAMDQAMKLPFKVSTTTSNFMIGVTAAASAGIYLSRGYIDPTLAMPVMLGVLAGSLFGTHILVKTKVKTLRYMFAFVIIVLGIEMMYSGITGKI
ncbi:MAG TPA: sulfite exporter TauE/SafE family protein [Acidobacteriaceae bacterium]